MKCRSGTSSAEAAPESGESDGLLELRGLTPSMKEEPASSHNAELADPVGLGGGTPEVPPACEKRCIKPRGDNSGMCPELHISRLGKGLTQGVS